MDNADIDGFLVMEPDNRFYLSGFEGSAGALLITPDDAILVTDFRYVEQGKEQAPLFKVIRNDGDFAGRLASLLEETGVAKLGFEEEHLTYKEFRVMQGALGVELIPVSGLIEPLRMIKGPREIQCIRRAAHIAMKVMMATLKTVGPGRSEEAIALEVEFGLRQEGASGLSFEPIVASGPRSALPHARPSSRTLTTGDLVVLDMGARYRRYCSDLTRTVYLGEPGPKEIDVFNLVLEAQSRGIEAIRPGVKASEADAVSRRFLEDNGYGDYFGHGLGHGLGLAVHEAPKVSPSGDLELQPGMVVTVEPGVYIPDWGGIRIEDMVLVTEEGTEVLTAECPKILSCMNPVKSGRG